MPIVANTLETALTDAAESADLDEGADNENFISNVLQKVFMDSKYRFDTIEAFHQFPTFAKMIF